MSQTVCAAVAGEVETPQERALRRVTLLRSAFQSVFETLTDIYRDEDWRYLRNRQGLHYSDFGHFVRDQLGGSASNARRYRQGVEMLVAPLQELAGPDTRVPVTPHDVAQLGQGGARQVVSDAAGRLGGVSGAAERTTVLRELIDSAIASRRHSPASVIDDGLDVLPPAPPAQIPAAADEGEDADATEMTEMSPLVNAPAGDAGAVIDSVEVAGDVGQLCAALAVVRAIDPAAVAQTLGSAGGSISAGECGEAAQRLARLSQILTAIR